MVKHLRVFAILLALVMILGAPQVLAAPLSELAVDVTSAATPMLAAPLRTQATNNSLLAGYLLNDTKVTVLEETRDFYKIDLYQMEAYIQKDCLEKRGEEYFVNCTNSEAGRIFYARTSAEVLVFQQQIVDKAREYVGVPYLLGGTTPDAFDCSGYTQYIYRQLDIPIRRICTQQIGDGIAVPLEEIQPGDLVLFQHNSPRFVSHVGMYVGSGYVLQSGDNGVSYMSVHGPYFTEHIKAVRRIIFAAPETGNGQAGIQSRGITGLTGVTSASRATPTQTAPHWVRTRAVAVP
jgi:cell wall-associated NlpC family hydrolase